jgi:hypothetical protein
MPSTEETIDIENSGNTVSLRLKGADTLTLIVKGDGAADYEFDARIRQGAWRENIGSSYSAVFDYDDVRDSGADEIRVRCSSGTTSPGDQATITLMAN